MDLTPDSPSLEPSPQLCLDRLLAECSPSLDTVKMQVYFGMNHSPRRERLPPCIYRTRPFRRNNSSLVVSAECLENIRRVVESRLSPVSKEITESQAKTREELEALQLRILTYILLRSSMGSPSDAGAVQEATGQPSLAPHLTSPLTSDLSV